MTRRLLDHLRGGSRISAGIATADQLNLGQELTRLRAAGIDTVHLDVMDGHFCPLVTTTAPSLAQTLATDLLVDVHLMVERPEQVVQPWLEAGAQIVTFHLEATRHPLLVLSAMSDRPIVRGVAVLPGTPLPMLEPLLDDLELILILAVNPGGRGERFRPSTFSRLRQVRELIEGRDVLIAVDGSISHKLAGDLTQAGADLIISGSAIFDGGNATANAERIADQIRAGMPQSTPADE